VSDAAPQTAPARLTVARVAGRVAGRALTGLILGYLAAAALGVMGIGLPGRHLPPSKVVLPVLFALLRLGPRWSRAVAWAAAGATAALFAVLVNTELGPSLMNRLVVDDGARPSDVIVVLSASTWRHGFNMHSMERFVRGAELLQAGWAPAIVFTGQPHAPFNRFDQLSAEEMDRLGLPRDKLVPFVALDRPRPMNTWGEAQSLRVMAADHGWKRVLVVTSPSHTYRAKLCYQAAGFDVAAVPSLSLEGDLDGWHTGRARLDMFADWVYETAALATYRARGRF